MSVNAWFRLTAGQTLSEGQCATRNGGNVSRLAQGKKFAEIVIARAARLCFAKLLIRRI